jgi:hypothetical protein
LLRELTDDDWVAVVIANEGTITRTVDNHYFAFNFFEDNAEYYGTTVYPDKVSAAKEYCIEKDLLLQVALRRLTCPQTTNDSTPSTP